MASEMRRAAEALVERRRERFESRHALAPSQERLEAALAGVPLRYTRLDLAWSGEDGRVLLDASFAPAARIPRFLNVSSLAIFALVAASVWLLVSRREAGAEKFLVPLFTGLAILAFPFAALGLSSQREAEEARARRAIRKALLDEDDAYPRPQRWPDED